MVISTGIVHMGVHDLHHDFAHHNLPFAIEGYAGGMSVLGQQDRHLPGLQPQAGMDLIRHREIGVPGFVACQLPWQRANITDFNTLMATPNKLQIGVTSMRLKTPLIPTPRLVTLNEEVKRIAIHSNPPSLSRRQGFYLTHDLRLATCQTVLQQHQSS